MAGGEPRLGITWMNMHTQSATNRRRKQEHERDLHAYNPGARRPKFVRSHSLAPIASKKSRLAVATPVGFSCGRLANHASTRTTQLDDRRNDEASLDEVERILI
jgi:hypothetical protein